MLWEELELTYLTGIAAARRVRGRIRVRPTARVAAREQRRTIFKISCAILN